MDDQDPDDDWPAWFDWVSIVVLFVALMVGVVLAILSVGR